MLKTASKPVDVQDLQFKLQCRLKIFGKGQLPKSPRSLLAAASRYGIVFVGSTSSTLKAIRFEDIEEQSSTDATNFYPRREINLSSQPHFVCINCDDTVLAVVVEKDNCLFGLFYDVLSFYKEEVVVLNEVRLASTPGLEILQANWHPTINNIFTECKSDGTLGVYELKDKSVDVKKLPAESKACCFCWSPKGKQIAVGSQDGKIIHYKPDLKAVKSIDAPPFEVPHSVLSLQWISNYQFVGVFKVCHGSDPECNVVLIDAPKTGNPVFTNFYDICYSNGNIRPTQFYTINEHHWNILLVASANSMEVGVLSNVGETWTQYILPDSARAELPLDENQDETFPIGITMDTSSVKPVLWGESYIQPAPSLILLSHEGVLCSFRMINLKEGAPSVNSPPDKVNDLSGLKYFIAPVEKAAEIEVSQETQNHREESSLQKNNNSTPTGVAPAAQTNSPNMFQSAHSTAVGTSQGSATPTTPLSIFKTKAPMQSSPCLPTNLFGGQISITPVRSKNGQPPTSAASAGTTLLSQIAKAENASEEVGNKPHTVKGSIDTMSFSSLLAGSASAETNVNVAGSNNEAIVFSSAAPITLTNLLSENTRAETSYRSDTNFSAQAQLQTNQPVKNSAPTSNVSIGSLKTNVPPSTGNISQTQVELEEKDSADIINMLTEMLKMECTALDEEIRDLIIQGQHLKINLNFEEMDKIVHTTEGINEFLKELVETCEIQSSEVHILKQTTIQSWAWLEEARSRFKESQDEELRNIMRSKPLDSVSEKHRSTLKQMQYYLNSQLAQSHKALDDQWDKFQDYCRKTNRLQLPTMEAIFQTMVKQNAILQKHNYILRDITSQIKGKQKAFNDASLFNPSDKKNNLESSFQNLKLEPESIHHIYHKKILNRVKSLPGNKVNQLRRILHNREVPHVMVKSQMSTSILNSTLKLDQYTSGQAETPNAKKVDFVTMQSSPLNSMPAPQISSTPLSAFASLNNVASGGKPQLNSRFGIDSQGAQSSSNFKSIKENVTVDKTTNSATATFTGDKLSSGPQISFPRNLSTNAGKVGGYSTPKATFNQGSDMLESKNTSMSITTPLVSITSTSKKLTSSDTPSAVVDVVTSAQSNIFKQPSNVPSSSSSQSSPVTKPFSFISSASQSNSATVIPSSLAVRSISSSKDSLGTASVVSPINKSNASSTFSFAMPKTTLVSSVASSISTTSASSGFASTAFNFGSSSSFSKNPSVSSNNSSIPSTSSTNDGAVSISSSTKFSGMVPKFGSLGTSIEAVPITTTASIFQTVATTSATSTSDIVGTTTPKLDSANGGFFSASSQSSIFNTSAPSSSAVTTTASIFCPSPHKGTSLFGTSTTNGGSLFGTATSTAPVSSTTSQSTSVGIASSTQAATVTSSGTNSIFGNVVASTTASSIFFKTATTAGPSATVTKSIFATSPATSGRAASMFSATSTSGNSLPISSAPIFGTSVSTSGSGSTTVGTSSSSNPIQSHTKSVFGNSFTTVGTTPSTLPTSSTSVPSTTVSIFGTSSRAESTTPNLFGTAVSSQGGVPAANLSLFGSAVTCSSGILPTSTKSIFGAPTTTTVTTTSIFGTASAPKSTASVINSQPTFGAATSSSIFGGTSFGTVSTTTASSVFENASTPFNKTAFESSTSASSPFGTPVATSPFSSTSFVGATSPNSVFGQTTSTVSPFSTTSAATSPFGSTTANVQSQFNAKPSSSDSLFGGTTPAVCSPFGNTQTFGTGFNSNTATPSSPFGQVNPSPNAFGTATLTENAFGQSSNSSGGMFGAFASSNTKSSEGSFGFGNLNVGNSSQSLFSKTNENKSPFGGGSFNPTTSTGSLFGSSNFATNNGNSVFGQSTFGSNSSFSSTQQSGPFSAGGGSIAQTGFGVSQNSEKTPAFGTAPSFGGSPAFGAAPTFGGAPAFGSTSPFGGTNKIFGSPNSSPAGSVFGSNTQQSSGFGSIGSQNSLGFGNLAQQSNNPGENLTQNVGFGTFASQNTIGFGNLAQKTNNSGQNAPFSGNSSFSSWR